MLQVDAIEHYESVALKYREKCEKEKVTAYQSPAGIAFVTFHTDIMAARYVFDDYQWLKDKERPSVSITDPHLTFEYDNKKDFSLTFTYFTWVIISTCTNMWII